MTSLSNPLILVDGSSYLFRAFHALPALTNSHGEATGAIHGVLNMLDKLRKDYQPTEMVVIFDAAGKTFRDQLAADYKANRPPIPAELSQQIAPLLSIIQALGYPLLQIEGVEADDVIGTLAQRYQGDVLISTGDKDMAQLVNQRIHLINTMSNSYLDRIGVKDKFGVYPEQIRDYLSLIGDSVDNVRGVDKVGPKTAIKWLETYGSLEAIMAHAEQFSGKVGDNLRAALSYLPLSYQLVTLKCDVPLDDSRESLRIKPEDTAALYELYTRYEFRARLAQLTKKMPNLPLTTPSINAVTTSAIAISSYETLLSMAQLEHWLGRLQQVDLFALDTETTSLNALEAELVGLSVALPTGEAAYIPVAHDYLGVPVQLARVYVLERLRPLLEDAQCHKVGQNLKYDAHILQNYGITLRGIVHDTMLQSYILDATTRHDLDYLAEQHLHHTTIRFADIAGKGKKQLTFNQIALEQAAPYAAEDADVTLRLHQQLYPKLCAEPSLHSLYQDLEIPLIPVLAQMERHGIKIDIKQLEQQSRELAITLDALTLQAYELAGQTFNLASPKQIQAILFDKLQLPITRKTPTGQASTGEGVLEELADQGHELPRLLLEHRALSKLKSTYTDKLPQQINPRTGRIHTSYHQTGTVTGRLSSSDPNLQNIPIRSAEGRRIRQAFIPEAGFKLVAADYSQIELRIMAHLSGDEGLLTAFAQDADIHKATAAEVFNTPLMTVSDEQRRAAKAINFGLIYGMSAFGLARQLGIERWAAQQYIDLYFERYPGVKRFMETSREQAKTRGYVETLFGRRLAVPDINARNATQRQYAERTAINAPMQGTAADIIKRAMLSVAEWLATSGSQTRMLMQVHDELVFEVPLSELESTPAMIITLMSQAATLAVPLKVELGIGHHWDEAH